MREHFDELRQHVVPVLQDPLAARAAGRFHMPRNQVLERLNILLGHGLQIDGRAVATYFGKVAMLVQNVGKASTHAGRKVPAALAEHDHGAVGHVFAAMVAQTFDYGFGAGVAHGKAFSGHAVEVGFAAGSPVKRDVADQDILFRQERGRARRVDDDLSAGEPLADVIVSVVFQL